MAPPLSLSVEDVLRVNGSRRFAAAMAAASPFATLADALLAARRIWLNEELAEWNAQYREKFGFVFMICASGRTTPEVLAELKRRYVNRPIIELEVAAQEELKITELRLAKLFSSEPMVPSSGTEGPAINSDKAAGSSSRTRPPITTHVLDVARGLPASGIEVQLEVWKNASTPPLFENKDLNAWATIGTSVTNNDGRSGQMMDIVDNVTPGFYRISFNTAKYAPSGFFPYVSIIFEIKANQTAEHFHVPLLHSPFSFTTYRGS
ncbi:hypothetical protein PR202_gn00360 [Eleusine coracana subsp. coracana]|uniref:Hydroxyisourate hydrolase n=1 Tax=Eleusine coracana subsp. coracana TaxID=191504 RepID=A0AAV5G322_ELECO|nr:hypothetical protein PR202_gn00360 [Eleusine coracana subsp. coracana]